ncbi:S8 family serine peptidase [Pelagerythrobacter rhizovicinus]|uniref:Peptidase S8 n=1 Tax=Pelagerythrobacter rhizovicinus TaxID=2268576 RepID=A0A4Q2KLE2_9SPHN|nr:S8 family serine peptidase [Pelagerythrobacter rhizovicinus]RXZ65207.1 peptidase S8 [Pelagerythrobacter rhizovicinus]
MRRIFLISAVLAMIAAPLSAQIALPGVQVPDVGGVLDATTDVLDRTTNEAQRTVEKLARDRVRTIDRLVRRHRDVIERDARGAPARRGEILVMDASPAALAAGEAAGFALLSREEVEGLGFTVVRLRVPEGMDLADAEGALARLMPEATVAPDNLHFQSGDTAGAPLVLAATAAGSGSGAPVGMIDGAPGKAVPVAAIRGFAKGAPYPSNHGSAIASLLVHAGAGPVRVADVYGTDQAGGNALAMAKGLGWLVGTGSKVVTISLVGPRNPLLERAIEAARRRGVVVVAAVGNGGPAAPPAYPASYDGVVAVTAVDGRRRALIEAGRALHLDYAAPGANIHGIDARGKRVGLRGTSFATPLVAARVSRAIGQGHAWRSALDAEAEDLGREGHDDTYGRGLVCGACKGVPKKSGG